MAVRSGLRERRPALGLLLRASIGGLAVYLLRENSSSPAALLIFFIIFWIIYLRPSFNNRKFLASALSLSVLPILLPGGEAALEWLLAVLWTFSLFLLLGVKNLILLRRHGSYETVHLLIIFGLGILYLLNFLPLVPQIIIFLVFFLLFREFYFVLAPPYPQRLTLAAAALAFVLTEIAWILSFLPVNFLAGAAFLALTTFLFHDLILHHFQGALSRQIILRNTTLFIALSTVLFLLPA